MGLQLDSSKVIYWQAEGIKNFKSNAMYLETATTAESW